MTPHPDTCPSLPRLALQLVEYLRAPRRRPAWGSAGTPPGSREGDAGPSVTGPDVLPREIPTGSGSKSCRPCLLLPKTGLRAEVLLQVHAHGHRVCARRVSLGYPQSRACPFYKEGDGGGQRGRRKAGH